MEWMNSTRSEIDSQTVRVEGRTSTWQNSDLGRVWVEIISSWHSLLLSAAVILLYFPVLAELVRQWYYDPDYSHAFLVPILSSYLIWRERHNLRLQPLQPSLAGLFIVLGSLVLLFIGQLGADLFLTRISLWGTIIGTVVYFVGWPTVRALAFPLCFLLLMIPLPTLVYNQIVFPLQLLASRFASTCLDKINVVQVLREGNLLILPHSTLQVVEACSGIRSLMSLMALSLGYGYLAEPNFAIRAILVLATIPVAIVSNGIRVMLAALLTYWWGPAAAEGFLHSFSGWAIFLVATILLLILHGMLTPLSRALNGKHTERVFRGQSD
jgi:exosortase